MKFDARHYKVVRRNGQLEELMWDPKLERRQKRNELIIHITIMIVVVIGALAWTGGTFPY